MTPEERINKYTWSVLQDLRQEILLATESKPIIEFELTSVVGAGIPSKDTQIKIIHKLAKQKAVKILEFHEPSWQGPRGWFKLRILQPKFDEVYEKYKETSASQPFSNEAKQKTEKDYEAEIDTWLHNKDTQAVQKIWQIVSAINLERQLRDQDEFRIPFDKLKKVQGTNIEDLEAILTNLQNKGFILVLRKLGETPPSNDPHKPSGSVWATIVDKPEIIHQADTQIKIIPQRFGYLVSKLQVLIAQNKTQDRNEATYPQENEEEKIEWSEKLKWNNNKEFSLGKDKVISFSASSSDRIMVFKMLVDAKGDWVKVNDMAKRINKSHNQVRTVIGQLNDKCNKDKIITIIPRKDIGKPGAYKIQVFQ